MSDLIEKQAVLDLCESKDPEYKVIHFKEDVECLPSVSTEKTGHWIFDIKSPEWSFQFPYKCSNCGARSVISHFCHNCGEKKVEPQESEE